MGSWLRFRLRTPESQIRKRPARAHVTVEMLECRLAPATAQFAVIGDFGSAGQPELNVSNLVRSWSPDFILTTGDDNYPLGEASTIDANIGQYYHDFIYPYTGSYGKGALTNRFYPSLGNHDWGDGYISPATVQPYSDYFTLPGNERYYHLAWGPVEFFMVDSDYHEPDGNTSTSVQATWLQSQLAASTATWKLVLFHHPPYSSADHGSNTYMQWPFQAWGASAVLSGHSHVYERLVEDNNFPYFVDGLGGASRGGFFPTLVPGSQVQYNADWGAMLVNASDTQVSFQFISEANTLIDSYTLFASPATNVPPAPANLAATVVSESRIDLSWTDHSSNENVFKILRSIDGANFTAVATVGANVTSYSDVGLAAHTNYYYRVEGSNAAGDGPASNQVSTTTFALPAPGNLTAFTMSAAAVNLAWTNSGGNVDSFKIERSTSGGMFAEIGSAGGNITTFSDTGLTAGTQYSYRVRATNADGTSAYSNVATTVTALPAAPTNLTANAATTTQINLAWVDNASSETGFKIERSSDGTVFSQVATVGVNITAYADAGLSAGAQYYYRVRAYNGIGDSAYTNQASSITAVPPAPTSLTATAASTSQINLAWVDNSVNESGFRIERATGGGSYAEITTVAANITAYSDTGLAVGTSYSYRVRATNGVGDSAYSNVATATTQSLPAAPTNLAATVVSSSRIDLAWVDNANNEAGFKIERWQSGTSWVQIATVGANVTTFSDTGLTNNVQYIYRVRAYNSVGNSAYSNQASGTTGMMAPSNLTASAVSTSQVNLAWVDNSSIATGNRIERSTDGIAFTEIAVVGATTVSYSNTGLAASTRYFYRVRGYNSVGYSAYSNVAGDLTAAPAAPSNLVAQVDAGTEIDLSWTDNASNEAGFRIERSPDGVNFAQIAVVAANVTLYPDASVTVGNQYFYRARAYNTVGNSAYSNLVSASTTAPAAPTNLAAAVTPLNDIQLTWTDNAVNEAFFSIERALDGVTFSNIATVGANVTLYTDSGLSLGNTYTYRVRAGNAVGNSTYSNVVSAAPSNLPAAPSQLTATAVSVGAIALAWTDNASNETGFDIERSTDGVGFAPLATLGANNTSFSDSGLSAGTRYYYRVRATSSAGDSAYSNVADAIARGVATHFVISTPLSSTAGSAQNVTVTALDAFDNTAPGYGGTIHFTSSDATALLPGDYPFVSGDNGTHTFSVTFKTAGTQSLTAADTVSASMTGTQSGITVNPAAATTLSVTAFPSPLTAGTIGGFTVSARDAYGNVATGYAGTVRFSSSDVQALLPADAALSNGTGAFSATLKTAGTQSLTATDTVSASMTGSQSGITINPAAASTLSVTSFPSPLTAGSVGSFTVSARDAYGNVATGYAGTVHFSSSDVQAGLPADAPLSNGAGAFSATLKTAGTQSLTATDTVSASVAGTQSGITVNPAAASTLSVTAFPSLFTAGSAGGFTVSARDAYGNVATGYAGTVHFSSSDVQALLPADATLSNGAGAFSATLKTAGTQSLTATDTVSASVTGSQSGIMVNPAAASTLNVTSFPSPLTAGTAGGFTVSARDAYGNIATGYAGTVHFSSSDVQAVLPADATLSNGAGAFSATLETAGSQSLTATDTLTSSLNGSQSGITVNAAAADHLRIDAPAAAAANAPFTVTVAAQDPFGNTAASYRGTIRFTSSDTAPGVQLPADYAFTATDAGAHTFTNGVTLITVGSQTLSVADTGSTSLSADTGVQVTGQAPATHFALSVPASATAGAALSLTLTALDASGNIATGYTGTVHFASTDPLAALPADYAFTADDGGLHTFTNAVILKKAGNQSVSATDTMSGALTGSAAVTVNPAAAASFRVTDFASPATAGTTHAFTVAAMDAYGNTASGYAGAVHFSSSDAQALLPADASLSNGIGAFSAILKTAGSQSLTATDTLTSSLTGSQSGITVVAAAASILIVTGFPASITAGVAATFSVTARDVYGNLAAGYTGTLHFTSSDIQAALPVDYPFTTGAGGDNGVHVFSAALKTAGGQSLTATDTLRTSLAGSQSGITVTPNAATHLGLSAPSSSAASLAFTVTVTVLDAYGNTVSGYRGAIHFTSSDAAAYLPADYTFVAADNGVHAFTNGVTLNTVGAQTVTATDKVTSSTAGNAAVTVTPATLPVAPTNLTATVISSNQINLSWTDNSNNETGFKIWRSLDGKNWTLIAIVGVNVTSYSDTGLASRTFYYYRVQATNSAGDSAYSLVVKKRTL